MYAPVVNYVLSPFEGTINTLYPQVIKTHPQSTKEVYKEAYKLDISVSNAKDIIDHFLSPSEKYFLGRLSFMVGTGTGAKNIFRQVDQIHIANIYHQVHG